MTNTDPRSLAERIASDGWTNPEWDERIAELEAEGMTTSDAQGVLMAELADEGERREASE